MTPFTDMGTNLPAGILAEKQNTLQEILDTYWLTSRLRPIKLNVHTKEERGPHIEILHPNCRRPALLARTSEETSVFADVWVLDKRFLLIDYILASFNKPTKNQKGALVYQWNSCWEESTIEDLESYALLDHLAHA